MKKHLFFILCLMALVLNTIPAVANDYLKIHFKDGHTERHYLKLVESISTSKYDMEGNLHDDYQTQRLVISGTTYTYPLADIDSISYHKVDIEQVKKDVNNVTEAVSPIFNQSQTVEEMEAHIEEIKAMNGVEEVWREGEDIILRIRDWHTLIYKFPTVPNEDDRSLTRAGNFMTNVKNVLPFKDDGSRMKVVFAYQLGDDERFLFEKERLMYLHNKFLELGFDSHFIPDEKTGEELDFDFYNDRLFDYDIVFNASHGCYCNGKHYILTGMKASLLEDLILLELKKEFDYDDIAYSSCKTGKHWYNFDFFICVSEDFIGRSNKKFSMAGPHFVINGSCSSLMGDGQLSREHKGIKETYPGNDSMAKMFFKKGADLYIGATKQTHNATRAGTYLLEAMLEGASEDRAFYDLDPGYKYENYEGASGYLSALIDLFNPNSDNYKDKIIFLNNVQTFETTEEKITSELLKDGKIELRGAVSPLIGINSSLYFGFRYAEDPDLTDYTDVYSDNAQFYGEKSGEIVFSVKEPLTPGKTYYYRAFTYDLFHHNWGETCSFTVPKKAESEIIQFKDPLVKEICVQNWDSDGDGELSMEEASAVESLGNVFENEYENIVSFNELQYFTKLTSISNDAFWGCSNLTSVTIPNSVTSIGRSAFDGCSSLTSITIPNSVTSIGENAFCDCSGLTTVTIGNSVTSIGNSAFDGCSSLTSIAIPNCVKSIGRSVFYGCSSLTSITIPNSMTSIGDGAFSNCSSLTSVTIPNSVTSIGNSAFYGCSGLTSITIPNSVTSIIERTFEGCTCLTTISIPNSVTYIGSYAFSGCIGLTSVTIGSGVNEINGGAFAGCSKLAEVYCLAVNVPSANEAFPYFLIKSATLHVPAVSLDNYKNQDLWKNFKEIVPIE